MFRSDGLARRSLGICAIALLNSRLAVIKLADKHVEPDHQALPTPWIGLAIVSYVFIVSAGGVSRDGDKLQR
jgi:hypothetical protein